MMLTFNPVRFALIFGAVTLTAFTFSAIAQQPAGVIKEPKPEAQSGPVFPAAPKKPVVNTYHGQSITDDYQWMENDKDAERTAWLKAQNAAARQVFDASPMRPAIKARVSQLLQTQSVTYYDLHAAPGKLFAIKRDPKRQQPLLVVMNEKGDPATERVVFDPAAQQATVAIDFYQPSHDGNTIALVTSDKGSEVGSMRFIKLDGSAATPQVIPRVQFPTAGGSVVWTHDNRGVYYTRYPSPGERPAADLQFYQQVYLHQLGQDPAQDRYQIGKEFPRIAEVHLETDDAGKFIVARVSNGDGGDYSHYLLNTTGPNAQWQTLSKFADQYKSVNFGQDGAVYLLSRKDAPRGKVVRMVPGKDARATLASARTVVAQSDGVIEAFAQIGKHIWVEELIGGPSRLRGITLGKAKAKPINVELPDVASVGGMLRNGNQLYANVGTYLQPAGWYTVDTRTAKMTGLPMNSAPTIDMSDAQVTREMAISKDGTKVPLNIISKKAKVISPNSPTMLTGYGGYGISMSPRFNAMMRLWLDAGGIWVQANLRGGGEYGEAWHKQGNLTNKQNVFDDFIGSATHLIQRGYTSPGKLVITGGSNGGLLMGAAFTQRPDLFGAVVSWVGLYDMMRVELEPNGAFNITEFGTVTDKAQFEALRAYSPYHAVKDGVRYPHVLFITGENDGRVAPWHSLKMTARMQAAAPKDAKLILVRTDPNAGHGRGTALTARIEEMTDAYSFIFAALGMSKL